jgi:hypothetical protein
MNSHTREFLQHDDYTISVESRRPDAESRWMITVTIYKGDKRVLPPRRDDDRSYDDLDKAEDAGIKLGRELIAGLPA